MRQKTLLVRRTQRLEQERFMDTSIITVDSTNVCQHDGLFSLNDFHKASGGEAKHRPSYFLNNDQTKALIEKIKTAGIPAVKTREGRNGGTYACRELVIAYAAWISAEFHLTVLRVFLERTTPGHQNTPVETGESTRIEAAYNAAHHAAVTASQYIFKAELEQKDWIDQRFVFGFDDSKTGQCWCKPLEYNALLVPLARLAEMIAEPGGFLLTNAELVRLATACCQRLALRLPTIDPKAA
jgi:hypothetical protein